MNLTIQLRADLIRDVLVNQFSTEYKALKDERAKIANALSDGANDGMYVKVKKLLKNTPQHDNSISGISRITFDKSTKRKHVSSFLTNDKITSYLFIFDEKVTVNQPHLCSGHAYLAKKNLTANKAYTAVCEKIDSFHEKVRTTRDDLFAVLASVKTFKKLQENTAIFDTFLPITTKSTALLPVASIIRVNNLKIK
jgi:hypothetical protein